MLAANRAGASHYELVEGNDHDALEEDGFGHPNRIASPFGSVTYSHASFETSDGSPDHVRVPKPLVYTAPIRTVSREGSVMRHPTPDLQSLQGAYVGNVERLEETAERLSLSSDIGEELRKIRQEQKRSESRSSSARTAALGHESLDHSLSHPRQFSTSSNASNSIIGLNSRARSGGYSNGYLSSPGGSVRSPSWTHHSPRQRQTSQTERVNRVSDTGQNGRPMDSLAGSYPDRTVLSGALQVTNHEFEESPIEFVDRGASLLHALHQGQQDDSDPALERPVTAGSTDTYQHGMHLFADFDGVHAPAPEEDMPLEDEQPIPADRSSLLSLSQIPSNDHDGITIHRLPGADNMIYYPAPVPMMLNLPQKLSKRSPVTRKEYRRSQFKDTVSGAQHPRPGLSHITDSYSEGRDSGNDEAGRDLTHLPPQLRAELFFEHKSIQQDVQVKGDSAVATLDSILDASAFAPVNAFIDHPVVGQIGREVYGKAAARRSTTDPFPPRATQRRSLISLNILKQRQSSTTILESNRRHSLIGVEADAGNSLRTGARVKSRGVLDRSETAQDIHEYPASENTESETAYIHNASEGVQPAEDGDTDTEFERDESIYSGAPTTLLAELQLRKQQQQQRGRTAAIAFPNGMHSTLLELDAVAQVQKRLRGQKQITLAWEDPYHRNGGVEHESDEDVPLGVLYPGQKAVANDLWGGLDDNQPLGLIAKRAMEDNEPLSRRRARLKGNSTIIADFHSGPKARTYNLEIPGLTAAATVNDNDDQGETLAQRLKRLKGPKVPSATKNEGGDFLSDVLSSFGGAVENLKVDAGTDRQTLDPEETLGQRRKRLQAEKAAGSREVSGGSVNDAKPPSETIHTMADILHARRSTTLHLTSYQLGASQPTPHDQSGIQLDSSPRYLNRDPDTPNQAGFALKKPLGNRISMSTTTYVHALAHNGRAAGITGDTNIGSNGTGGTLSTQQGSGPVDPIDPKQAAMINRWRQSVKF
ncbi:hypothetical protein MMC13_000893 [Lambiella insularis]|nr:hypothetical protein [Lambiella insularis]